jgi:Na+/proline symporter
VLTQDVIAPIFGGRLSGKRRILLTRILIVVIGLYVLYWGLLYEGEEDIWDYMAVTGAIYFTGAFALLVSGLYWRGACLVGTALALAACLATSVGPWFFPKVQIPFWIPAMCLVAAILLLLAAIARKRASSTGAVLALLAGFAAVLGLTPAQDAIGGLLTRVGGISPQLLEICSAMPGVSADTGDPKVLICSIPSAWVGLSSIGATLLAVVVGSLLFPDKRKPSNSTQTSRE